MRVIASFVGGWGHAEPLLPLAGWARDLGHEVTFAGQAAVVPRLAALGYGVDVVGPDTLATEALPLAPVDRDAERTVMRDHFVAHFGASRAQALTGLFRRERPGLVVCDEVDVGAVVAAERLGIPCVTVDVIAAGMLTAPAVVGDAWGDLRRSNGLAADPDCSRIGGSLVVAPLPRSLRDPRARPSDRFRFVRPPILDEVAAGPAGDGARPLVYVTLGTVFNLESGDLFERLARAMASVVATHDVDVLPTTGPGIEAGTLPPVPSAVRVEPFVPQREVLARCAAVMCHGGSGTLVAALSLGIPVVTLPMGADQPDNADRCRDLGVGPTLDPLTATPAEIAAATTDALRDPATRQAARELAAEAAAQPRVADLPDLQRALVRGGR